MYVQIITAMEFSQGQSFLNVGSGSGYLSCLVSCLIGEGGVSHGIEINADLVKLSMASCKSWFDGILSRRQQGELNLPRVTREGVSFVQGNCFDIDIKAAKSVCLYDRIYIGAGCPEENVFFFLSLLADDGMLIAPIQERGELVRIRKIIGGCFETKHLCHVHYVPLIQIPHRRTRSDLGIYNLGSGDEGSVYASDFDAHVVNDNQESHAGTEQMDEDGNIAALAAPMHQQTSARELVRLPTLTWRPTYRCVPTSPHTLESMYTL
jgi:protein-L-isoaspartate O-methyltransferase